MRMIIKRYRPAFFEGFKDEYFEVSTKKELLESNLCAYSISEGYKIAFDQSSANGQGFIMAIRENPIQKGKGDWHILALVYDQEYISKLKSWLYDFNEIRENIEQGNSKKLSRKQLLSDCKIKGIMAQFGLNDKDVQEMADNLFKKKEDLTQKMDSLNVRQALEVPELQISPVSLVMQRCAREICEKETAVIEDILRHHIENPIEGEITREKIAAAGILGIVYDEEMDRLPFSEVKVGDKSVTFEVTSALLGVVQGEWLIGPGGIRRPLTKKELQKLHGENLVSDEEYIRELRKNFDYEKFKRDYCGGWGNTRPKK